MSSGGQTLARAPPIPTLLHQVPVRGAADTYARFDVDPLVHHVGAGDRIVRPTATAAGALADAAARIIARVRRTGCRDGFRAAADDAAARHTTRGSTAA